MVILKSQNKNTVFLETLEMMFDINKTVKHNTFWTNTYVNRYKNIISTK